MVQRKDMKTENIPSIGIIINFILLSNEGVTVGQIRRLWNFWKKNWCFCIAGNQKYERSVKWEKSRWFDPWFKGEVKERKKKKEIFFSLGKGMKWRAQSCDLKLRYRSHVIYQSQRNSWRTKISLLYLISECCVLANFIHFSSCFHPSASLVSYITPID